MTLEELEAARLFTSAQELADSGQTGAAMRAFQDLCQRFPDDPQFYIAFGRLLQSLGHWEQSIEKLRKGVELKPHYCEG